MNGLFSILFVLYLLDVFLVFVWDVGYEVWYNVQVLDVLVGMVLINVILMVC